MRRIVTLIMSVGLCLSLGCGGCGSEKKEEPAKVTKKAKKQPRVKPEPVQDGPVIIEHAPQQAQRLKEKAARINERFQDQMEDLTE